MTERLRRTDRPRGAPCGCRALGREYCLDELLFEQAWSLYEAPLAGGLMAAIGVGGGKTGLNILIPMVMPNCKKAALLLPPRRIEQFWDDYLAWNEHFLVPSLVLPAGDLRGMLYTDRPTLFVVAYSRFSRSSSTELLDKLDPDLIVADEGHSLKNRKSTRGGRAMRHFVDHPETRLTTWSGTFLKDSLLNFQHLAGHALGDGSPLPIDPKVAEAWAAAVDDSEFPASPGPLVQFCAKGESLEQGVGRRMRETLGFVCSLKAESCHATMPIRERVAVAPRAINEAIHELRQTWTRPDGEEFVEALDVARCARELACGFFYRWRFPGNPKREDVDRWFAARKAWNKEMRRQLEHPAPHLDSPELLQFAAERAWTDYRCGVTCIGEGCTHKGHLPTWRADSWPAWRDLKDSIKHKTEAVWIDDYLVRDAAEWMHSTKGIVWVDQGAFGERLEKFSGLPRFGGGRAAEIALRKERGTRSIIVSRKSHGEGTDGLQLHFCEQLVAWPPAAADTWEQLLGRLHRRWQKADEVLTLVYRHTVEMADAIDRALRLAKYVEGMFGSHPKLLAADMSWSVRR